MKKTEDRQGRQQRWENTLQLLARSTKSNRTGLRTHAQALMSLNLIDQMDDLKMTQKERIQFHLEAVEIIIKHL